MATGLLEENADGQEPGLLRTSGRRPGARRTAADEHVAVWLRRYLVISLPKPSKCGLGRGARCHAARIRGGTTMATSGGAVVTRGIRHTPSPERVSMPTVTMVTSSVAMNVPQGKHERGAHEPSVDLLGRDGLGGYAGRSFGVREYGRSFGLRG